MSDGADGGFVTGAAGVATGMDPAAAKAVAPFFPCFDGLRALGVMSVIAAHVAFVTGATAQTGWGDWFAHLEVAPAMFFFISGFLLYRPYVSAAFAGKAPLPARTFWWRRLLRVFPAYWVALTVLILGFDLHVSGWHDYVVYYGLFQIYDTHRFLGAIPQAYTLCVELSFYVVLPGYVWLTRKLGDGKDDESRLRIEVAAAAVLAVLCYGYRACIYRAYGRTSVGRIATHWLPGFLDVFALGIALAAVSVYVVKHGSNPIVDLVARLSWLWWGMAACCLWIVTKHLGLIRSPQPQNTPIGWKADAQQLLQTLFAGLIALPAIFGPQDRGAIRKFLQWKPIALTGLVSYGFYLWHEGWLEKWLEWTGRPNFLQLIATHSHIAFTTYPLILVLTVFSSLATAGASYYLVDRPVLRLKNHVPRLFGGRGTRA